MKVTMWKCDTRYCGRTFEVKEEYLAHERAEKKIAKIEEEFPSVEDSGCRFANGGWNVKRSAQWVKELRDTIISAVGKIGSPPLSYGWYRTLDDTGNIYYSLALRLENICKTCNREWGQPYYAINCNHKDKEKL